MAEHYRGFVRFSEFNGVLGSEIEPNNRVLSMLRHHFCSRYHNETFFIYDRTHCEALFYAAGTSRIVPLQDYLELDDRARINTPSTLGNNWCWRVKPEALSEQLAMDIRAMTQRYGR